MANPYAVQSMLRKVELSVREEVERLMDLRWEPMSDEERLALQSHLLTLLEMTQLLKLNVHHEMVVRRLADLSEFNYITI